MIHSFAYRYRKLFAYPLFVAFYVQVIISPLHAAVNGRGVHSYYPVASHTYNPTRANKYPTASASLPASMNVAGKLAAIAPGEKTVEVRSVAFDNGGPVAPEASSFKAVGSDNLVNLFTGDFSYSIPLMDVGGYPVNLFYNGGITMEQEASWVGLGWNINPGTVNRSVRGVPDDFNGEDQLIQKQNVKPNRTWGGEVGIDGEVIGIKQPKVNFSLGMSVNNYLGPALEIGAGISLTIPITENIKTEKVAGKTVSDTSMGLSASVGVNGKLSSRSGLTLSPSLNASLPLTDKLGSIGAGISTSYNSRTGIKELNFSMSASKSYKDKKGRDQSTSLSLASTSIDFARPTYMPTLRMPMEYANYSGQLEFGAGMFGLRGAAHGQGYYSESVIPEEWKLIKKPLVGFMYSEKANGNKNAVMDFSRLNDGEVTPNTPILSAPQYAYDVFSIQGEGTGGSIRAYRGDLGFMRDNETRSKDKNISLGVDIAPPGHYGGNWNVISTPTRVGGWEDGNNTLRQTLAFEGRRDNSAFENVYFRNPGESTVTNPELIDRIGADNLVRFKLGGSNANPRLESVLEQFNKTTVSQKTDLPVAAGSKLLTRDKRSQVITMLTAKEATDIGLEKTIRNYTGNFNNLDTSIQYTPISRSLDFRKLHHISEINVLEQSGMRYVYGLPVYNVVQKEYTFSVQNVGNPATGIVNFQAGEPTIQSPHTNSRASMDGYVMTQETPAYASSFLLTGLLSPDYVDITSNGITEDDLGNAVKFDYQLSADRHKWRTPRNNNTASTAHYNEGLRSEKKDNKATISYGEREVWYLHAIESKSMVAIFKTETRSDAKGVYNEMDGRIRDAENANKKLAKIDLYTKAEIRAKGINGARPIKTVHFDYAYTLCKGTPDNNDANQGKLTLRSVYFSYNGQSRSNRDRYIFNYGDSLLAKDNPSYQKMASDKWGTYKDPSVNPVLLTNADYPFTSGDKEKNDNYAAAWSLKKVLLPSGAQMDILYEASDYAYVQNRRAADMLNIYGLGNSTQAGTGNGMYSNGLSATGNGDNLYVYVKIPEAIGSTTIPKQQQEIKDKYLEGVNQLAFKLLINMPDGEEPLTVYAQYEEAGLCPNIPARDVIYIKLKTVDGKSPLSKSAIGFLTETMPGQAFPGYRVEVGGIAAFLEMIGPMVTNLKNAFKNVDDQMRSASPPKARTIVLAKSFVRLNNGNKKKYGGGVRVKRIVVKDNWNKMTRQFNSTYGQDYEYTTKEKINGVEKTISSGVASYEPGLGSEENPFREIVSYSNKMPLASAQYGAIEMPMLDALYPAPGIGYSKVIVRSIHRKGTHQDSVLRSAIGKQVTEFYTAKDYPVFSSYTTIKAKDHHFNSFFNLLYKEIIDRKTVSQGFLVETNDMHGKMKMQAAYSESDENTPLSYSYHSYKNTGRNGLNDKVNFVYNELGGQVIPGNMGIDMELMTDVREFKVSSDGFNGQIQTDFFTFVPWPVFGIFMLPIKTITENKYRAVTCTKLINYHAIEDSVVVMDKGSVISTKTIAYDAETGAPVVTKTANEFKDPVYNVNYPAHWAYSGMGPAYKNIDRQFSNITFREGRLLGTAINQDLVFESGDELYVTRQQNMTPPPVTPKISGTVSYHCSATNNGQGSVTLSFNFPSPTPSNLRMYVGWVYQNNQGYGGGGVNLPSYATHLNPGPYYIDVPAGATTYSTPFPKLNGGNPWQQFWPCFDGLGELPNLYKKAFVLKVHTPANYIVDLVCTTPGLIFLNDISNVAPQPPVCISSSPDQVKLWAFDKNKSYTSLTTPIKDLMFIDAAGNPFTKDAVSFRIVRSGKRNNLGGTVASATTLENPIQNNMLLVNNSAKVIQAGAGEMKEKWAVDCNVSVGNPYVNSMLGNFKTHKNFVYYGSRADSNVTVATNIRRNGTLAGFSNYWYFNTANNLVRDTINDKWVHNNELLLINGKSQDLQSKDALNRHSSMQYGFAKNLTVAVAQNSPDHQMLYEGFEDAGYRETINNSSACIGVKKVPFPGTVITYNNSPNPYNIAFTITNNGSTKTVTVTFNVPPGTAAVTFSHLTSNGWASGTGGPTSPVVRTVPASSTQFKITFEGVNLTYFLDESLNGSGGMKAHTGSKMLLVEPGDTISAPLYVSQPFEHNSDSIRFNFGNGQVIEENAYGTLPGVIAQGTFEVPSATHYLSAAFQMHSTTYAINNFNWTNYMEGYFIPQAGQGGLQSLTYNFEPNHTNWNGYMCSANLPTVSIAGGNITIRDEAGNIVSFAGSGGSSVTSIYKVVTNPYSYSVGKVYKITTSFSGYGSIPMCNMGSSLTVAANAYVSLSNTTLTPVLSWRAFAKDTTVVCPSYVTPIQHGPSMNNPEFRLIKGKKMLLSAWLREDCGVAVNVPCTKTTYDKCRVEINAGTANMTSVVMRPTGNIIEGWQKVEGTFTVPDDFNYYKVDLLFVNEDANRRLFADDIRIHPFNANMKSYAYDPRNLRLAAEMDENNFASFYEYDEEGQLIRIKKETIQGVKTVKETRASKQQAITTFQD